MRSLMKDEGLSHKPSPWTGNWKGRLQAELSRSGFGSLEDFLLAHPGVGYVTLSRQLAGANIAPAQLFGEQLRLGLERRQLRGVAMDSLVRSMNERVPRGWRNGRHFRLRLASAFAAWSVGLSHSTLEPTEIGVRLHRVFDALEAMPIPTGWLPKNSEDPFITAAFATEWPEVEE
jgi:hypothetical protein